MDFSSLSKPNERGDSERDPAAAVQCAFGFVRARSAMRARG